jgi:hypothetical protein
MSLNSGVVVHTCNPSIQKAEAEDCKSEASLGYIVRSCLRKTSKQTKNTRDVVFSLLAISYAGIIQCGLCVFLLLGFELGVLHLLGKSCPQPFFPEVIFHVDCHIFAWGWPQIEILRSMTSWCSWGYRCMPPHLTYWLR